MMNLRPNKARTLSGLPLRLRGVLKVIPLDYLQDWLVCAWRDKRFGDGLRPTSNQLCPNRVQNPSTNPVIFFVSELYSKFVRVVWSTETPKQRAGSEVR